jgi:xanthine dehydrogenase YagS FAD-binding subunit
MNEFRYERAAGVAAAVAAVAGDPKAVFLGGGTNLVDHMRLGIATPELLVDVTRLPLDRVEEVANGPVRIGAAVKNSDLAADPLIRRRYPVLAQALLAGASGQLRNLATTAGNLMQRTRSSISRTSPRRATSERREPAARRSTAGRVTTRSSAPRNSASRSIPPTWRSRWRH